MNIPIVFCLLAGGIALAANVARAQEPPANYDESKVGSYTLPDPLVFNNGKPVRSAHDWNLRRREILTLFEENVFGHGPKAPRHVRFRAVDVDTAALGGKAVRKQVTIYFSPRNDGPQEDLLLYIPAGATKPVPLFLTLNFSGNQAVINDPGVKLATIWVPQGSSPAGTNSANSRVKQQAPQNSRGTDSNFEVEKVLERGYGLATIYYQDIEPDFNGGYRYGIRPLFAKTGATQPPPDGWGAIGAWAYGLSSAMDYLEQDRSVDSKRVVVMGHSRLGKTALWAGALDHRFAMVISSCPGEGGASLARRNYGETIKDLTDVFPYWFAANLAKYAEHVDQLPVDMHELIALSAPRPVYVTGAEEDRWADPKGEFLACVASGPVYRLLGAQDLGTDEMPPLNTPIMHTIGFHIRTGKHEVTSFDWDQFLKFADMYLR